MTPETRQALDTFSGIVSRAASRTMAGRQGKKRNGAISTRLKGSFDPKVVGIYNLSRMDVPENGAFHRAICKDMPFAVYPEQNGRVRLEFTPAPLPVKPCH